MRLDDSMNDIVCPWRYEAQKGSRMLQDLYLGLVLSDLTSNPDFGGAPNPF